MPLYVEDVGEVRLDRDLDRQAHHPPAAVDDVVILVDAAAEGAAQPDRDRVRLDRAGLVDGETVSELEPGREELAARAAQEDQHPPAEPEPITADVPGVP